MIQFNIRNEREKNTLGGFFHIGDEITIVLFFKKWDLLWDCFMLDHYVIFCSHFFNPPVVFMVKKQ